MSAHSPSIKQLFASEKLSQSGRWLTTASIAAMSFAIAPAAKAQCVTTGNDTVCTGTTTGPQVVVGDDQTYTVEAGAVVESAVSTAITIDGVRNLLVNNGQIIGTASNNAAFKPVSMVGSNGPITFVNNGVVSWDAGFILLETNGGDIGFENTGFIQSQNASIGGGVIVRNLVGPGDIDIVNLGQIDILSSLPALAGSTVNGSVSIANAGTGEIRSAQGDAISAVASADILINNRGILTAGNDGIRTIGSGETVVSNDGAIIAGGAGISSRVTGGSAIISNVGVSGSPAQIDSVGRGIFVDFVDGTSASVTNSGVINTTALGSLNAFTGSSGIQILAQNSATNASFNAVNTADGVISTLGFRANGISIVNSGSGTINIENAGTITTQESLSQGLAARLDGQGSITIINSGVIDTAEASSFAAKTNGAAINISNSGTVTSGALAIEVASDAGNVSIDNSGDLTSLFGVQAQVGDGELFINNSGSITATATGTPAIFVDAGNASSAITLDNTGIISAANGSDVITVFGDGDQFNLTSAGVINGNISTIQTEDFVSVSGFVDGDIILRQGNDTLTYNGDGTGGFSGRLDGGVGDDGLIFASTGAYTFSQNANSFETVNVLGVLILDGASFTDGEAFTIDPTGDLRITTNGATIDAPDGFVNNGTLGLVPDANLTITNGGFSALSGSTTIFGVDAATPQITADGAIEFAAGSQIEIDVLDFNTLVNGRSFDAAVSGTSATDNSNAIIDNSMLFDFSSEIIGGNILRINVNQALMIPDAVDPNDATALGSATGLQALVDAGDVTLSTLFGQLPDDASVANGVEQFIAGDSGGVVDNAHFTMTSVSNVVQDRLQFLPGAKNADGDTPKTAISIWGNAVFGGHSGDADGFAAAYDGSTSGFVIGSDIALGGSKANAVIGGGYYNLDGDVHEFTVAPSANDLKSSGGIVYVKIGSGGFNAYLQGAIGTVDVAGQRQNSLTSGAVTSAYSGDQQSFTAMIGYAFPIGTWSLTPRAEFLSIGTDFDSYTEQAASGALEIGGLESDLTSGKFELEAATSWQAGSGFSIAPDFRASVATTSRSDDALAAQFVQGGNPFRIALGDRDGTSAGFGAGLSVATDAGINFRVSYDGEFGDGYDRHVGHVTAQIRF